MRIAFIYDALYPDVKGGVERRLYELGKRLSRRHEVHWYTFGWWGKGKTTEREGIIIHGLGKPVDLYKGDVRNPWEAIIFSWRLLRREIDSYDVIDCQEFPYLHAYPARVKFSGFETFVITWHEYWGDYWVDYLPMGARVGKLAENGLLKLTDNHVVVSRRTLLRLAEVRAGNFGFVPNGIDFEFIRSVEPHPELKYDAVFVGRLIKHKNVLMLLNALKLLVQELPSFRVAIIGDGPQRMELESLARTLGIRANVDFLGFLPRFSDVVSIVKSSRLLAFPSLREGFGMVVLEANAAGIPVVTVNSPLNAATDLIIDGLNGYVSDPTPEGFAEKLLLAWENSPKMKRPSLSLAKKYDWNNIANRLEKYYKGVANGS
ncbi:glycosyltransferase family 1 protein [Thermococcus sp. 18S1]|uniref:glycosyltransferase family 4 protein n=1 Tax=Thermococcus sp. 18S1 TaxID=1638210 RepID=UPI00143AD3C1|nr:glycosyltransferase family 4 protein [Thermococcus sp. 18S1]NJE30300.1 glycosyltransferase family 1 protein [Thermococcus sp. 18S1]